MSSVSWATRSYDTEDPENPAWSTKTTMELDSQVDQQNYIIRSFEDSYTGKIIRKRQAHGRDYQAIITSMGGERGLGKTTLAMVLARETDLNGWSIDKGYMNVWSYMKDYINVSNPGDVFVQDETEIAADARRAMGASNVKLSQVIAACRFKEVSSIYTLPTKSMLDDRIFGLCTFWIHVVAPGTAAVFYISQNDFTGEVNEYPLRGPDGNQEYIYWPPLDEDSEYQQFSQEKEDFMKTFIKGELLGDEEEGHYTEEDLRQQQKDMKRDIRDSLIRSFDKHQDWPQERIASEVAEIIEDSCSQQHVSKVVRNAYA